MATLSNIYGSAKTGKEFKDANLQTGRVWVAYVDLRCVKDHIISAKNPWRNGNLFPVMGTVWKDRSSGTDVVGKLPIGKAVKTQLSKKFRTNNTYIYLQLTVFSACSLYGDSVGKNAGKSNRFESKFYLPIDQYSDMIMNVESKYGRISANTKDIEAKIEQALKSGQKGSASVVGTAKTSGKYISDKQNKYSNKKNMTSEEKSNDLIYNGPRPKKKGGGGSSSGSSGGGKKKNKEERVKVTAQYEVTLNTGQTVTATVTYHGPADSKITKIGAKKLF